MNGVVLILVAHTGKTLQLDVQPSTRVDAVQDAVVHFTGIPVADQIVMYQGARLDPAKLLAAYRLPVDPALAVLEDHPVFLYCRSYLKPGAALPPQEALPPLTVQVPPLAEVALAHPLHSAASPLVRALPDYERHFQHHLATTRAYWEVAQARLQRCRQLLSEQEVQARAADAARANVEAHFGHILASYNHFMDKYRAQAAAHAQLLATFPADLAALEAIELHPALQALPPPPPPHQAQHPHQPQPQQPSQEHQHTVSAAGSARPSAQPAQPGATSAAAAAPHGHPHSVAGAPAPSHPASSLTATAAGAGAGAAGPRRLSDLYPVSRLREWAETCRRSHASFASKVAELEALFEALRRDVEGLLQQAPSVDLDSLGRQMAEHEALLDEHSSMVQVLSKDLRTVRTLVEDVVRQLGSTAAAGGAAAGGPGGAGGGGGLRHGALHDAAAAMEAIHETHRNRVLPRLAQLDGRLASFAAGVEGAKVGMARDVVGQLQRISGQQGRIRDMRHKLAAFAEVLGRQEAAFAELRAVHRLPSAYRALLAEAVRRAAWHQLYCGQAGRLSDHMARFREKEAGRRATFTSQVSRYLPPDLLARAGLASEPPACDVTVPPPPVPVIAVHPADLQRLAYLDERRLAASASAGLASRLGASAAAAALPSGHAGALGSSPGSAAGAAAAALHAHSHHHHHASHHHHHHHHQQEQRQHPSQYQPHQGPGSSRLAPGGSLAASQPGAAFPGTAAVLDADPGPPPDPLHALELENARLRAELANHIAAAAVRELTEAAQAAGEVRQPHHPAAESPSLSSQASPAAEASVPAGTSPGQRRTSAGGAGGAAAPGAAAAVRRDPAELLAAMQRALGMKDDLIRQQQREVEAAAARAAAYEQRIAALEAALAARGTAGEEHDGAADGTATAAQTGAGSGNGGGGADPVITGGVALAEAEAAGGREAETAAVAAAAAKAAACGASSGADPVEEEPGGAGSARTGSASEPSAGARVPAGDLAGAADEAAAGPSSEAAAAESQGHASGAGRSSGGGDGGAPAGAAPASPFSLPVAQEQPAEGRAESPPQPELVGAAGAAVATAPLAPVATAPPAQQPLAAVAAAIVPEPPQRGSSGPQAIPAGPSTRRRGVSVGVGAAGGGGFGNGSPYEHRVVPMAMGSLPFATSLPSRAGSLVPGRLASSPGGGIGLGLALGFGLGPLAGPVPAEPAARRRGSPEIVERAGGHIDSESESGGGSRGGRRRESDGGDSNVGDEGRERAATSPSLRGGRSAGGSSSVGGSSSSGSGSSGLQFQPAWSVMHSGSPRARGELPLLPPPPQEQQPGDAAGASVGSGSGSQSGGSAVVGLLARGLAEQQQQEQRRVEHGGGSGLVGSAPGLADEVSGVGEVAAADSGVDIKGAKSVPGDSSDANTVAEPLSGSHAATATATAAAEAPEAADAPEAEASAAVPDTAAPVPGDTGAAESTPSGLSVPEGAAGPAGCIAGSGRDEAGSEGGGSGGGDDAAAEEVPDIDEVIDSGGAWELASTEAGPVVAAASDDDDDGTQATDGAASAAGESFQRPAAGAGAGPGVFMDSAVGLGASTEDAVDLAASGAEVGTESVSVGVGRVESSVALDASQLQLLEPASSGYESVGSVMSAADAEGEEGA